MSPIFLTTLYFALTVIPETYHRKQKCKYGHTLTLHWFVFLVFCDKLHSANCSVRLMAGLIQGPLNEVRCELNYFWETSLTYQIALIANTTAVPFIPSSSSTSQASTSAIDFSITAPIASSFSTLASNSSNGKGHSNAGAIAGGVVGGLVFLSMVFLGLLWWIMRKRRNAIQKDLVFDSSALVSGPAVSHTTGPSHPQYGSPPVPISSQSSIVSLLPAVPT